MPASTTGTTAPAGGQSRRYAATCSAVARDVHMDRALMYTPAGWSASPATPSSYLPKQVARLIEYGASPRATIAFCRPARALAVLSGRDHVIPDDIATLAHRVLRHRLILGFEAASAGVTPDVVDRRGAAAGAGALSGAWANTSTGPRRTSAPTPGHARGRSLRAAAHPQPGIRRTAPYVPGDDVRDIDWKASARSGSVLIKRFVSEKHHKILLVADAGRNMSRPRAGGRAEKRHRSHTSWVPSG